MVTDRRLYPPACVDLAKNRREQGRKIKIGGRCTVADCDDISVKSCEDLLHLSGFARDVGDDPLVLFINCGHGTLDFGTFQPAEWIFVSISCRVSRAVAARPA